jgi:hypothetical protein
MPVSHRLSDGVDRAKKIVRRAYIYSITSSNSLFLVQQLDETSNSALQISPQVMMPTLSTIAYTVSIYTLSQMKKPAKKRGDARSISLELESGLEWDAFKAKVLAKICVYKPTFLSFDDYTIKFTVPRVHPKPTNLEDEDAYRFMVGRTSKSKDPCAALVVEPIIPEEADIFYRISLYTY